ncbi:hypothetical protein BKA64DRAFT_727418 [Cadophora sp. MPI-SDFR-AT-0126]|nr:hypothetical protein BKA64DRAFT_727418 [Leotiomycetes sp. MPI-SDFR-AT-0126]
MVSKDSNRRKDDKYGQSSSTKWKDSKSTSKFTTGDKDENKKSAEKSTCSESKRGEASSTRSGNKETKFAVPIRPSSERRGPGSSEVEEKKSTTSSRPSSSSSRGSKSPATSQGEKRVENIKSGKSTKEETKSKNDSRPGSSKSQSSTSKGKQPETTTTANKDAEDLLMDEAEYYDFAKIWPSKTPPGDGQPGPGQYNFKPAGYRDTNPYMQLRQDPLEWKALKTLRGAERESEVIARAKFHDQNCFNVQDLGYLLGFALMKAVNKGRVDFERPQEPIGMPSDLVRKHLPRGVLETKWRHLLLNNRINEGVIMSIFNKTQIMFKRTTLARAMSIFVHDHLRGIRCSEIVAFGGGSLGYAAQVNYTVNLSWRTGTRKEPHTLHHPDDYPLMCQTQHAALLFIRHRLEHLHRKTIPVCLTDSDYSEEDAKAAKRLKMTVVNSSSGFQKGWTRLNESTLVVDLHTNTPIIQRIFEISRLAAITTLGKYNPDPGKE